MKRSLLLVFLFVALFNFYNSQAQCPGCVINTNCTSNPPAPTICPTILPNGYAMQPYSQDLSFYLPHNFDDPGSGYNVDLQKLEILNVAGLPYGLNFQTNASPSNIYYPTSNPPTSEYGCARICGTPVMPGNYTITVFVKATVKVVSLGGITQTSNSSFQIPLTILPPASSNNGFTIINPYGCAPHSTGFICNRPSNGNPNYHYLWNFGNGNQSTLENPPVQTYNSPGNYVVTLQTQIDTLPYYLQSLTVISGPNCNDSPWSAPDFYFKLKLGSTTIYTAPYIDNTNAPVTFSFTPIQLSNATYTIEVYDYDTGLLGGDDQCGTFTFNGYNAGTHTLTAGQNVITIIISHPVLNFTDTDTIKVFQGPIVGTMAFTPNDSICQGDSVLLSITDTYGGIYQWYKDSLVINGANAAQYYAKTSGKYMVEVSNTNGCRAYSNMQKITVVDNPPKPGMWTTGNTLNTNLTGYSLQWYYEGNPINGATGLTYNFTMSGNYYVIATNWFGCSTSSDTLYATYSSGLAETETINAIQIVPNPNNGKFSIQFDANTEQEIHIRICDLAGRIVYQNSYESLFGRFAADIDLGKLQKGMYLVEIISGKTKANSKLIIQ